MSMSATCLESHQLSEIQKRYFQNCLLAAPRQEKGRIPLSNYSSSDTVVAQRSEHLIRPRLTGSQKRRLKRKKREEGEEEGEGAESEEKAGGREKGGLDGPAEREGREKKVSKRSVHWNALKAPEPLPPLREAEERSRESEAEEKEGSEEGGGQTFFGWLSSYFPSR
jgi:hypothetical protein